MSEIYISKSNLPLYRDAIRWCTKNFGHHLNFRDENRWVYGGGPYGHGRFRFMFEEDAILFALKWA